MSQLTSSINNDDVRPLAATICTNLGQVRNEASRLEPSGWAFYLWKTLINIQSAGYPSMCQTFSVLPVQPCTNAQNLKSLMYRSGFSIDILVMVMDFLVFFLLVAFIFVLVFRDVLSKFLKLPL